MSRPSVRLSSVRLSSVRLSSGCLLSLTLVHATQRVQLSVNILHQLGPNSSDPGTRTVCIKIFGENERGSK